MNNYTEYLTMYHAPHASLSISIEGCMESGKIASAAGQIQLYGGTATGLATIADSLTTIKYMVFDKSSVQPRTYDASWPTGKVMKYCDVF